MKKGPLILAGAPLGNSRDLSLRVRDLLGEVDLIAAEDTRRLLRLCSDLEISLSAPVVSFFAGNEAQRTPELISALLEGKTVLASKAGRAPYPIAGIIGADMNDLEYIEELIKRAKSIGFTGVALIHPKHVAIANRIFRLTEEEVTYHRQLIESYEEGIKKGLGAVRFRDAMIDQAMYERSMELLSNQT